MASFSAHCSPAGCVTRPSAGRPRSGHVPRATWLVVASALTSMFVWPWSLSPHSSHPRSKPGWLLSTGPMLDLSRVSSGSHVAPPALGRGKRVAAGGEMGARALSGWLLCQLFLPLPDRLEQALGASGPDSAWPAPLLSPGAFTTETWGREFAHGPRPCWAFSCSLLTGLLPQILDKVHVF